MRGYGHDVSIVELAPKNSRDVVAPTGTPPFMTEQCGFLEIPF